MAFKFPPCPPLDPSGFGASVWQQWFDALQKAITAPTVTFGDLTVGKFGANGAVPQAAYAVPAAAVDPATTMALANALRLALIANGTAV